MGGGNLCSARKKTFFLQEVFPVNDAQYDVNMMRMQMIVTHNTNPRGNWQELVDRQPCGQLPGSVFNLTPRTLSLSHSNTHVCVGVTQFLGIS